MVKAAILTLGISVLCSCYSTERSVKVEPIRVKVDQTISVRQEPAETPSHSQAPAFVEFIKQETVGPETTSLAILLGATGYFGKTNSLPQSLDDLKEGIDNAGKPAPGIERIKTIHFTSTGEGTSLINYVTDENQNGSLKIKVSELPEPTERSSD